MKMKKIVLDGRWKVEPTEALCPCGKKVHMLSKGRMRVLPKHNCPWFARQKAVEREMRLESEVNTIGEAEAARRLSAVLREDL